MSHLYVHIPYCRALCPYCDFLSNTPDKLPAAGKYVDALLRDLDKTHGNFDTIFMGGGTPNELPLPELDRLLGRLSQRLAAGYEWTIETNPQSFTEAIAEVYRMHGANRISFGIQSAHDEVLKRLGRAHRHRDSQRSVALASEFGFNDISGDIIFGLADDRVEETVAFMVESHMTHVSAYELTIEGTSTWKKMNFDPSTNDEDKIAKLRLIEAQLKGADFHRYEVSNFALSGHECRSHLNVWRSGEFAAIGAGAHGFENGRRYWNTDSIHGYLIDPGIESEEIPNPAAETMLLGMRMPAGINLSDLPKDRREALNTRMDTLKELMKENYILVAGDVIRPTDKGLLFVNTIAERMM